MKAAVDRHFVQNQTKFDAEILSAGLATANWQWYWYSMLYGGS